MSGINNNAEVYSYRLPTQSPECVTHLSIHRQTSQERPASGSGQATLMAGSSRSPAAGNIIRWGSVDRNPTPTGGVQIQPLEVQYTRDGQRVVSEHGTKMTVDGDAYTLVILECAPQQVGDGDESAGCDCHSRCFCQTEFIVRQQMVPSDHVCQHNCQQQNQYQSIINQQQHQKSQPQLQHHYQAPLLAIERPASSGSGNQYNTKSTATTSKIVSSQENNAFRLSPQNNNNNNSLVDQQRQWQQKPYQQSDHNELLYPSGSRSPQPPQQPVHQSTNKYTTTTTTNTTNQYNNQQSDFYQQPQSYQPQQQQQQAHFQPAQPKPQYHQQKPNYLQPTQQPPNEQYIQEVRQEQVQQVRFSPVQQELSGGNDNNYQQPQHQQPTDYSSPSQHPQTQRSPSQQSPQSQSLSPLPKGKTRLVKKWDWNQAQFITVEVPDRPTPKPATSRPSSSASNDVWNQDLVPSTSRIGSTSQFLVPPLPTSSQQRQQPQQQTHQAQFDPSWTAYRVPDMDSVQSDPLYRDLLFELQRLEEGVKVREEPIVESETFQRPVFGQSITPEHIEVKEYENIEFVCRLIPNSDPNMKIEWTVNGKPLQESNRYTNDYDFGVVRLRIKRCDAEDSGIYQCKATNSMGEAITTGSLRVHAKGNIQCETLNPAGLDKIRQLENPKPVDHIEEPLVQQPPKFLTHIIDYVEKDEGESVHFECCLAPVDDPDLKTEWFFNGRPLVTGSRFHTIDDFGFIVLDIDWLFPRDTGEYVCRATNKYGTDITRTVLRVRPDKNIVLDSQLDNPMIIDKLRQLEFPDVVHETIVEEPDKPAHFVQPLRSEQNRQKFIEGDNVHFEARVGPATDGNLTVEWYHDEKPLISGHRFKPTFDFGHIQLDILYVYPEDSGVYKCITRNTNGMDVSQFEIHVTGKPSLVYQSQLPKEMVGGVQKITEMEAMWNRAPDPEAEEPPRARAAPEFVLKPKPCTAFENSCARFCCQITANPRPRITWVVNGQTVVTGSRYKLFYDGIYHLIIYKAQLSDAGKVEVYARNPLGECFATTELKVKRKVDDYRGVLKNSPNPWYDEQSLKMYQRQRSQDLTDDDDFYAFQTQARLQFAAEQQAASPTGNQLIGYMEPETPDVNLLAHTSYPPLVEPGDLHPVVAEQQVVMAPAPSTIQKALSVKDSIKTPEKSFNVPDSQAQQQRRLSQQQDDQDLNQHQHQDQQGQERSLQYQQQDQQTKPRVFGVDLPRYSAQKSNLADSARERQLQQQYQQQQQREARSPGKVFHREGNEHQQQALATSDGHMSLQQPAMHQQVQQVQQQQVFDSRLPPQSPESMVHGKEVHAHTHKQTTLERRTNKEIVREIVDKEIYEQEHKGVTKENVVRGSSVERSSIERGSTPGSDSGSLRELDPARRKRLQQQPRQVHFQQQQEANQQQHNQQSTTQHQVVIEQQQVFVEDYMVPPEFIQKIQPCQAIDGDEARFECSFKGDPKPTITWFRESKMLKPSNMYNIITDNEANTSALVIKRVALNSNAVYTVKAENAAGSAKSSANLVVEAHPLPESSKAGLARKIETFSSQQVEMHGVGSPSDAMMSSSSSSTLPQAYGRTVTTTTTTTASTAAQQQQQYASQRAALQMAAMSTDDSSQSDSLSRGSKVKSVKTRQLSADEMAALIRASPEGVIAPTFLHTIHDSTSKVGDVARLDARLLGSPPMDVRWLKDGQRVRADRNHKMVLEGDIYTLLILECSPKDEGTYECLATNRVGEARCEAHLMLASADGTTSAASMASMSSIHGSTARSMTPELISTQSYSMSTSADYQQKYLQQQQQLQSQHQYAISDGSQSQAQHQQQGHKQHYGPPKHQFAPMMGQYTSSVEPSPNQNQPLPQIPKLIKCLENQQVKEGKSVTLRCQISSFPIAEVHWYKHGDKLIKPSKYFRIFKDNDETYCLKILETFPEDQGEYRCVARAPNGHTYVETKATVTVIPNI